MKLRDYYNFRLPVDSLSNRRAHYMMNQYLVNRGIVIFDFYGILKSTDKTNSISEFVETATMNFRELYCCFHVSKRYRTNDIYPDDSEVIDDDDEEDNGDKEDNDDEEDEDSHKKDSDGDMDDGSEMDEVSERWTKTTYQREMDEDNEDNEDDEGDENKKQSNSHTTAYVKKYHNKDNEVTETERKKLIGMVYSLDKVSLEKAHKFLKYK